MSSCAIPYCTDNKNNNVNNNSFFCLLFSAWIKLINRVDKFPSRRWLYATNILRFSFLLSRERFKQPCFETYENMESLPLKSIISQDTRGSILAKPL